MSQETSEWLNNNVLVGFTKQRGHAWHYRAADQGAEPNHYPGPIPVGEVRRRLFHWKAQRARVLVEDNFGLREAPDLIAVTADDNGDILGVHTDEYGIHQYGEWLLDKVETILDGGLAIGSAGLLRERKQAWVSVEVPETITTPEGVSFRPNLLAFTSHNATYQTWYKRVATNVVCDNTLTTGIREPGQQHGVRHRRNSEAFIPDIRDALNLVHTVAEEFSAEVKRLCETIVTDRTWRAFLDAHAPVPEGPSRANTNARTKQNALTRLWTSDERVSPWRGTGWGVLQAVNTYQHHEATIQGACRAERNMANALEGKTARLDRQVTSTLRKVLAAV